MLDTEIAWAAGLLEGEGSFFTKTNGHSPVMSCAMTDLDILQRVQKILGGTISNYTLRKSHWKKSWVWRVSGDTAADGMKTILPYMGERRASKINEVLSHWYEYGRPYQPLQENLKNAMTEYFQSGGSVLGISKRHGVNRGTLRYYIDRHKKGLLRKGAMDSL